MSVGYEPGNEPDGIQRTCSNPWIYNSKMPARTVGHYLKQWGYTPQKPVKRAYERSKCS